MSLNAADALRFKEDALQQKLRQLAPDLSWQPVLSAEPWFYRRSARLALRRGKRGWELGFRQAQSHQLAPIDQCQVLAEPLRQTLPLLSTWLLTLARDCPLGHIDLLLAEGQVAVQLHVSEADESLLDSFRQLCQQQLWFGYYSCRQQTQVLQSQALFYRLDELQIGCTPSDFIQVNGKINELMLQQAIQWLELDVDSVVMDAFSGIGNFSLPLAKRVKHVVAVEGIEVMTQRLLANATANGLTNVTAYSGDLSQAQSWQLALSSATHVLLDPARAGAVAVADAVRDSAVKRMLYISCNPLTLVRDLRALVNDGWQLQQAGAVDMFPHTKHLEAMVLLSR